MMRELLLRVSWWMIVIALMETISNVTMLILILVTPDDPDMSSDHVESHAQGEPQTQCNPEETGSDLDELPAKAMLAELQAERDRLGELYDTMCAEDDELSAKYAKLGELMDALGVQWTVLRTGSGNKGRKKERKSNLRAREVAHEMRQRIYKEKLVLHDKLTDVNEQRKAMSDKLILGYQESLKKSQALMRRQRSCMKCGKTGSTKSCSDCHKACYCSTTCSLEMWPEHKKDCKMWTRERLDRIAARTSTGA
jgi:hypothetical protein